MIEVPTLVSRVLFSAFGSHQRLTVLIFHRVLAERDEMRPGEPTVEEFAWQMRLLRRHFNPLPLAEAVELLAQGRLPGRAVSVTFDDGYADNLLVAAPILQGYDMPATVFVASGYIGGGRMWNDTIIEGIRSCAQEKLDLREVGLSQFSLCENDSRRRVAGEIIKHSKHLPPSQRQEVADAVASQSSDLPTDLMLNADQLRQLVASGVDIGGHTITHPILARVDEDQAWDEINGCKRQLEEMTGQPVRLFAYPNGRPGQDYLPLHARLVERAGFEAAVSTRWGAARPDSEIFHLPRFTPWDKSEARYLTRLALNLKY